MRPSGPERDNRLQPLNSRRRSSYPVSQPHRRIYEHLPVSGDPPTIRLLDLEARPRNAMRSIVDGPLVGRLRTARLQDSPSFTALSYVWGQGKGPVKRITCGPDGASLDITYNCYAALQQVRKNYGAVTIWVDSICINQQDEREKTLQIPLMEDIYTWATRVYIWLGDGTPGTDRAMKFLRWGSRFLPPIPLSLLATRTDQERRRETVKFWVESFRNSFYMSLAVASFGFLTRPNSSTREGFKELLETEWMHRAWTFQEAVLASDATVLYGSQSASWASILHVRSVIAANPAGCDLHDVRWKAKETGSQRPLHPGVAEWRSMMDVWLYRPRPLRWNGTAVGLFPGTTPGSNSPSFLARLANWGAWRGPTWIPSYFKHLTTMAWSGLIIWALVVYGSREAPLPALLVPCAIIGAWALYCLNSLTKIDHQIRGGRVFGIEAEIHDKLESSMLNRGIYSALRSRKSTQVPDRLYAFGAILGSLGAPVPTADYGLSPNQVFRLIMETLLSWRPVFIALVVDAGGVSRQGLPSWMPNFETPHNDNCWLTNHHIMGDEDETINSHPPFSIQGDKLILFGKRVGHVIHKTNMATIDPSAGDPALHPSATKLFEWAKFGTRYMYRCESLLSRVLDVLQCSAPPTAAKTISADRGFLARWTSKGIFKQTTDYLRLRKMLDAADEPAYQGNLCFESFRHVKGAYEFLVGLINNVAAQKRCLFAVDLSGTYESLSEGMFGSGPIGMKMGDQVYILRGVPLPMVLRETRTRGVLTVVGPAYVYGMMQRYVAPP
ncbi:heterokaryon incompatibility protein-domain-containing protein [Podospora aff. communis PSN243]|uniref:Heterokaryon incompatibility protein-domain-containing protein n=1 Tax=Podospora aff. communis PSN243 TaxID=3040156 RepID=A0AAV9G4B2_9PEZI|nr:heterokaryon incompatibility protein-domain-containing protein [Podospora aff. communis PSN243]